MNSFFSHFTKSFGIIVVSLAVSGNVFSKSIEVVRVTNDNNQDEQTSLLVITDDENDFVGIQKKTYEGSKLMVHEEYSLNSLRKGVTIFQKSGVDILKLKLDARFEPRQGGPVVVDYLQNAITGRREKSFFELNLIGSSWKFQSNNRVVKTLEISVHKVAFKTVGISSIKAR